MKLAAVCTSMEVMAKPVRGEKRTRAPTTAVLLAKKDSEKERRQRMKELCEKLMSLIPNEHNPHADTLTHLGGLDVAAIYIKKLKDRAIELQHKKASMKAMASLRGVSGVSMPTTTTTTSSGAGSPEGEKYWEASAPVLEVRQPDDSSIDVRLICNRERPIKLHEVITILEEEGAIIVNANHSVAGQKIFYTIHSRAFSTRIGIDVSRISERLGALKNLSFEGKSLGDLDPSAHLAENNQENRLEGLGGVNHDPLGVNDREIIVNTPTVPMVNAHAAIL